MDVTPIEMLDDFTIVTHNKKKKKRRKKVLSEEKYNSILDLKSLPISLDVKKIQQLQKEFEISTFFEDLKKLLSSSLDEWIPVKELHEKMSSLFISESKQPVDIVCYGLGSFGSCLIARYQLVLLLALKDFLNADSVYIYDPVFSNDEMLLLKELRLNILSINEEAKRTISHRTIFFMPHCDLPMYNNLLWSNWNIENLSKLIVIGNSFSNYSQSPKGNLQDRAIYIHFANQFVEEVQILNNYVFSDVFNNFALHYFKHEALCKVNKQIWLKNEEPVYEPEDAIKYF